MFFEEAYEKYKNGTATLEEKEFVEQEIAKAKKINTLLNDDDDETTEAEAEPIIATSKMSDVLRAKKSFLRKANLRILVIVLSCMVIVAAAVLGSVFGIAVSSAKRTQNVSMNEAEATARQFIADNLATVGTVTLDERDRDLQVQIPLKSSRYVYYIEFITAEGKEVEIAVDARTGIATIDEID